MQLAVVSACGHPPGIPQVIKPGARLFLYRGVAQLVARTAGGREVAGSSPVTPTMQDFMSFEVRFERLSHLVINNFFTVYTHVQVDNSGYTVF